jgi:hypothetical protein
MNESFNSGGGTKLIAGLIFLVGACWIVYGGSFARKLNNGYINFTPSGFFMKRYIKTNNKSDFRRGMGSAVFLDSFAAKMIIEHAPFPLNYLYWLGMYPLVPFALFGVLPALATWLAVGPLVSLGGVMDAGGDGTEYVEAKQIHWFYSLSPEDRERVREGSDLEDDGDGDRSDSDDEERGLTKAKKKKSKRRESE